jgi:hypothetical protein
MSVLLRPRLRIILTERRLKPSVFALKSLKDCFLRSLKKVAIQGYLCGTGIRNKG